jgi:serine/threonine protein kinase
MSRPAKLGPHDPPQIGPYTTLARLGRGGQGEVYLAADSDGKRVAVKVLRADWDPSGVLKRSLDRELVNARKVAQFVTAKVLDFDVVGELPYIVSEYIEGLTLAEHVLENGPLKDSDLLQVAIQALTALEAIHQAGIIHCDFKPANVILGQGGARVIDFGIAKALDSTHRLGEIAGTFPYMAPEQVANKPLTSAVDLFAWGSTMVFAATGGQAFPGDDREQVARMILTRPPRLDSVDEPLRTSIRACLQKAPDRRPTAAQARKLLFGRRPKQTPDPVRPVKPAPSRPTRVERPVAPPVIPSPQPGTAKTGKAVAVLAGTVAAAAALIWAVPGLSDGSRRQGDNPSDPPPASTVAQLALPKTYEAFWPGVACKTYNKKAGQESRDKCPITDGIDMFCAQWTDVPTMAQPGNRPASLDNDDLERAGGWRNSWHRLDSDRHGNFYSYPLSKARESGRWAIWWEDSHDAVSCYMQGPPGSQGAMVDAFLTHDFLLNEPVPSRPS